MPDTVEIVSQNETDFKTLDMLVQDYRKIVCPVIDAQVQRKFLFKDDPYSARVKASFAYATIDSLNGFERKDEALRKFEEIRGVVEKIVAQNDGLCRVEAKKYREHYEDILQDYRFWVFKAVLGFDHTRGIRFSTYAWFFVKKKGDYFTMLHANSKAKTLAKEVTTRYGTQSDEEIMTDLGIDREQLLRLITLHGKPKSLSAENENEQTLEDVIGIKDPAIERMDDIDQVEWVLAQLDKKERDILIRRFGLYDREEETLETIGSEYHITRERVRQIEQKALGKAKRRFRLQRPVRR